MALSVDSDFLDPYADLRIAHMGFRRRQYEWKRAKSEDLRDGRQYEPYLDQTTHEPSILHEGLSEAAKETRLPSQRPPHSAEDPSQPSNSSNRHKARGLNIRFGLPPSESTNASGSPRLEGSAWEMIEDRTQLMAQLHTLQEEIIHLARRDNERVGISTPNADKSPPLDAAGKPSRRSVSGWDSDMLASTSFSSNDTLVDEDPDGLDIWGTDTLNDGDGRLMIKFAELQRLRELGRPAPRTFEEPSASKAAQQIVDGFGALGSPLRRAP